MSTIGSSLRSRLRGGLNAVRRKPADTALLVGMIAAAAYVIVYPFTLVRYPPLTDLPEHASCASILRHYLSPSWHFREQFELHPLEVPYISVYVLGAILAIPFPIAWAAKLMSIVMLAMLPCGLAVLFAGMRKSPLLGVLGLGLVWNTLTQWGFLNHVGAVGLFAASVGCTLLVLDDPTRARKWALCFALLAVFFTHIFRYPFALLAVGMTTVVMYPATRRALPVVIPALPSVAAFVAWSAIRPSAVSGGVGPLVPHYERFNEIPQHLFGAFNDPRELELAGFMLRSLGVVAVVCAVAFFAERRHVGRSGPALWWGAGVTLLPLALAAVFVGTYLVLPMSIGLWWFVYPREITTAVFIGLAAVPDLPRALWLRVALLATIVFAAGRMAFLTALDFHKFDEHSESFHEIVERVPAAPRLMYLVFDHTGTQRVATPFIHMPAWILAERGGWISWHFASWNLYPIRYRVGAPNLPPPRPERWEWTPERFNLDRDGPLFDTFVVRMRRDPGYLFAADPTIQFAYRSAEWWLYRRPKLGSAP